MLIDLDIMNIILVFLFLYTHCRFVYYQISWNKIVVTTNPIPSWKIICGRFLVVLTPFHQYFIFYKKDAV